jgi:hypothetical protein
MAARRNGAGGKARRKRRPRPPWGGILGGKPIESRFYFFDEKRDLGEHYARLMQHIKMVTLKAHYGIQGGDNAFPIRGVAAAEWLPWYQLALAIASDLDDSLKVVDAKPPGKTARRWQGGVEGHTLIELVDALKQSRPGKTIRWYLQRVRTLDPNGYGRMSLNQLVVRFSEAKRHHGITKAARDKGRAS